VSRLWQITWLYIKTTYRDRSTLIFAVAMPLIFTFVIGLGISGFSNSGGEEAQTWRVDIVGQNSGELGKEFIATLKNNTDLDVQLEDEQTATNELDNGDAAAVVILPTDLSTRLEAGEQVALQFQLNADDPLSAQVVEQAVLAAVSQLSSSLQIAETSVRVGEQLGLFAIDLAGAPAQEDFYQSSVAAAQAAWKAGPPITLASSKETRREDTQLQIPNGFQQTSPGIAVMFTMFFIVGGASSILLEREQGTLRRLLITPASKATILGGKLLGVYIAGTMQFTLLVLVGQFFFHVDWGHDPLALAAMVLSFTFSITALGMLVAALVRTYAQVDAISTVLILPLAGLGGAMWPIEIVPAFMQKVALWLPTGWAMRGFQDIITRGLGLSEVLPEAGVLMVFGIAFLAIGVWRFKYE
jgi:ABC-2 type transport system permease protein